MKKLTNTAKKLDTFFKIMQAVLSALAIAAAVCTGLILIGVLAINHFASKEKVGRKAL